MICIAMCTALTFASGALPVGMQLVCLPGSKKKMLYLAHKIERAMLDRQPVYPLGIRFAVDPPSA